VALADPNCAASVFRWFQNRPPGVKEVVSKSKADQSAVDETLTVSLTLEGQIDDVSCYRVALIFVAAVKPRAARRNSRPGTVQCLNEDRDGFGIKRFRMLGKINQHCSPHRPAAGSVRVNKAIGESGSQRPRRIGAAE